MVLCQTQQCRSLSPGRPDYHNWLSSGMQSAGSRELRQPRLATSRVQSLQLALLTSFQECAARAVTVGTLYQ